MSEDVRATVLRAVISVVLAIIFDFILQFQLKLFYNTGVRTDVSKYKIGPLVKLLLIIGYLIPVNIVFATRSLGNNFWSYASLVVFVIYCFHVLMMVIKDVDRRKLEG